MTVPMPTDVDFLSARLHGRRSRLAEADRLDALCRIRTVLELARTLFPDAGVYTAVDLQRRLVLETFEELGRLRPHLLGAAADLLDWLQVRYQVENLKVLARAFGSAVTLEDLRPYLLPLPGRLALRPEPFLSAGSIEAFIELVPPGPMYEALRDLALEPYRRQPRPFFLEVALDHAYLKELDRHVRALPAAPREGVRAIARQEIDTFHLLLLARGRFVYQVKVETLRRFGVPGSAMPPKRFRELIFAPTLAALAERAVGYAIEALPDALRRTGEGRTIADVALLETLAWNRYYRVANRTFRTSHMGLGAIFAFVAIRRIELANLITLSEGIRAGLAPDLLRRRLIPRRDAGGPRV